MATAHLVHPLGENRLLQTLPPADRAQLLPHLQCVTLRLRDVLVRPQQPITHVTFPLDSVVSLLTGFVDGALVETGIVGNEGMVGLSLFFGVAETTTENICQQAGTALVMSAADFGAALAEDGPFRQQIGRYAHGFMSQVMQCGACNRHHTINERAARWLLMMHDRVGVDGFILTHEFFAHMLGVRRAGVTVAAGTLQQAGLISYHRGQVTILDREQLEAASCECYQRQRDAYAAAFR